MKIAIYAQKIADKHFSFVQFLFQSLLNKQVELVVYESFYREIAQHLQLNTDVSTFKNHYEMQDVDYMFSIGGDGTLLKTITYVREKAIPILEALTQRPENHFIKAKAKKMKSDLEWFCFF